MTRSIEKRSDSMSREQVRSLYSQADAFVLPTRGEGWGLPVAEVLPALSIPLPISLSFSVSRGMLARLVHQEPLALSCLRWICPSALSTPMTCFQLHRLLCA